MHQLATQTSVPSSAKLSVSYKSSAVRNEFKDSLPEAVIITDPQFIIKGFNSIAASVYGIDIIAARGEFLFDLVQPEMIGTTRADAINDLFETGYWKGDIIYKPGVRKLIFSVCANLIKDETGTNNTVLISAQNISKIIQQEHDLLLVENELKEIDKMYERYHFAVSASTDAIWDLDIISGSVYRGERFNDFTGYKKEDVLPTTDWFINKVHEQDRNKVKEHLEHCIEKNVTNWEIEYRFQIADGSFRYLLDKAQAIFEQGKLIRVIGAMQNITERKKLEAQLLHEQVQKQKMINKAIIKAQEKERNRISGELHDNVNQLLMSAKLHICVAKNKEAEPNELLEKANEYLLMAVEEIRNLSKKLTSTLITNVGLQKSIADIAATMLLLKDMQLHSYINNEVVEKLSPEQQLMVFRIIQEQSNNILKYAETNEAIISLKEVNQQVELIISDNGVGFDKTKQKANGIGFINIFNRVDAYNGKVEIITAPGEGCTLIINFPITEQ